MERRTLHCITAGCAVALFAQWLYVGLASFEQLNMYVQDDGYYYIMVARHWVREGFPSLDGVEPTNGFQPLWQIMNLPPALVADRVLNLKLVLGLGALLYQLGVACLALALGRLAGSRAALALVVLVQLNVATTWTFALNGMESSLQIALLGAILLVMARSVMADAPRLELLLGLLAGLYGVTRLDNLALIPFLALWIFWRDRRFRTVLLFGVVAAIPALVFFAANQHWSGGPFPVSGEVKLAWNRAILEGAGGDVGARLAMAVPNLAKGIFRVLSPGVNGFLLYFACPFDFPYRWITFPSGIAGFVLVLAAVWRVIRKPRNPLITVGASLIGASAVRLAFYTWNFPSDLHLYRWYYAAELFIFLALAAVLLASLSWWRPILLGLGCIAIVHIGVFLACDDFMADYRGLEDAATHLGTRPDLADEPLGSWDAGCVAFRLEQPVTNLDGVINSRAYLRDVLDGPVPVADYLRRRGIRHVLNIVVGETVDPERGFRGLRPGEYTVEYLSPPYTGPFRDVKRFVILNLR